jgi:branched-chain amino acid transport system substrate-binding protein
MKIGRLLDHPTKQGSLDYGRLALDLVFDELNGAGGIAGERVSIVEFDGVGSQERVAAGARALAQQGCLLILGPSVTDFAVPLIPVLDEIRVPSINWAGSALARGAFGFQLKVGSLPDEAGYLTQLLAARGHRRVAVVRDRGPIGDEYFAFLRPGFESLGAAIAVDLVLAGEGDVAATIAPLSAADASCVLYLGFGTTGMALCRALRAAGVALPLIGNIGIGVFPSSDLDGVVFTDVVDETNPVLQAFAKRYAARHGEAPSLLGLAAAHDLATTAVAALRAAPELTPPGVRAGLESLRGIPAAIGAPGTTIGFAPWDRDGYKGPLVVLREIRDGRAVRHRL